MIVELRTYTVQSGDTLIGIRDALGVEVLANLPEHVVLARLLEIRKDDGLGILVGLGCGEPELVRCP